MKKFTGILTVSLVAVMAVGAARADLAATTYVDDAVAGKQDVSNMATTKTGYTDNDDTKYPTIAVAQEIANIAAGSATGELGALAQKDTVSTGLIDDGAVTSAKIADGTIVNADIAGNAAIDQAKIAGLDSALNAKEASANKTNTYNATATDKATKFPTVSAAEAIADAKVKPVADRVTTAEGNITTLQTNVTNLSQNLDTTINNKIDTALGEGGAISEVLGDYATNEALNTVRTTANAADSLSKTNKTAIDNINNGTTGILAQAKADATTKADAAKTGAVADAKTYADTELAKKQNKLTQAVNGSDNVKIDDATGKITLSGIATNTALTTLEGKVTANTTGVTEAKEAAQAAKDAADAKLSNVAATGTGNVVTAVSVVDGVATLTKGMEAIPVPTATNNGGKVVLTWDATNGYAWESIGR